MKKFVCLALLVVSTTLVFAQRAYYVYLESVQPFFVKLDDRTYSSGNNNYIILPGLADSTYLVRIGFPQNRFPDQVFRLEMKGNDHGYLLRAAEAGDWALDEQGGTSLNAEKSVSAFRAEPRNVSRFTEILAKATNDPSLRFNMVRIRKETKPAETKPLNPVPETVVAAAGVDSARLPATKPEAAPDTVLAVVTDAGLKKDTIEKAPAMVTEIKPAEPVFAPEHTVPPPVQPPAFRKSVITRRGESSTTLGFGVTFIDEYEGGRDTIRILIPPASGKYRLMDGGRVDTGNAVLAPVAVNCKNIATEVEIRRASKKMKAAPNEKAMLAEAAKLTRSYCISTAGLRELGRLFPGDGGRFKLFEQSYSQVSDPAAFHTLEQELGDNYFIDRFRALQR
ncbi:MAG: hypothetical protein EOO09_21020 [Chitinophagaceae bacterium]|nr:MAG: hypothetical protein EOO09_21020 [Chitinophagaceae bacterium]